MIYFWNPEDCRNQVDLSGVNFNRQMITRKKKIKHWTKKMNLREANVLQYVPVTHWPRHQFHPNWFASPWETKLLLVGCNKILPWKQFSIILETTKSYLRPWNRFWCIRPENTVISFFCNHKHQLINGKKIPLPNNIY